MTYFISPGPISSLTLLVFIATLMRDLVANARAATRRMTASEPGHGACQDTSRGSDKSALRTRVACHCRIPHSWPDKYVCLYVCISVSLCVCASVTVCVNHVVCHINGGATSKGKFSQKGAAPKRRAGQSASSS